MALINPAGLYTEGAVALDSRPHTQLAIQLLQKSQAKQDALDQYDANRMKTVNDKGLRDVDRPDLDKSIGELQQFYQKNKDNIQKGTTPEAYNYEKMYRDINDLVSSSKDAAAKDAAGMKLYGDRFKADQRVPDDFMGDMHNNSLAVRDPNHKRFDIQKWSQTPPPFDPQKYTNEFKDIKREPGEITFEPIEGQPLMQNQIIESKFNKDAKDVIAARAIDAYDNKFGFSNQVKNEIADPTKRKVLTDIFKQKYGVEPQSPHDYAIASTFNLLQPTTRTVKPVPNTQATIDYKADRSLQDAFAKQTHQAGLTYQNAIKKADRESLQTIANIDNIMEDEKKNAVPEKTNFGERTLNPAGELTGRMVVHPNQGILDAFSYKEPDTVPITDKDGKVIGHKQSYTTNGTPVYKTVSAVKTTILPDGNREIEFNNGTKQNLTPLQYKSMILKSKIADTKAKQSQLGDNTKPITTGSSRSSSSSSGSSGKTYNVINPKTGAVIMQVDEAGANKAKAKGYKIQ